MFTSSNPSMKKWLTACYWLVIAGLVINFGRLSLNRWKVSAQSATNYSTTFAYTAVLKETDFDGKGSSKEVLTNTWAVRSDGSRAIRIDPVPGSRSAPARMIDYSNGQKVHIHDNSGKKSTVFTTTGPKNWIRDVSSNCLKSSAGQPISQGDTFDENEEVNGYRTARITNKQMTYWFAIDYGCAMVRFNADWGNGAGSEQNLIVLIPGEPSQTLFAVSGFQEVPPSGMLKLTSDAARQLDQQYYSRQTRP